MTDTTARLDAIQDRYDSSQKALSDGSSSQVRILHRLCESANDVPYLLDLARAQQAAIEAVRELAATWHMRGENDMAYSKAIPDEDIAMHLLTEGASMVENARHIRNALNAALEAKP